MTVRAPAPAALLPRTGGNRAAGLAIGLAAAAAFATSGPFVKPLLQSGWSPGGAVIVRLWLGAVLLALPTALVLRGRWHTVTQNWRLILAFGLTGVAAPTTFYFLAVDRLPVAVALLIEYTGPLLLILWSWLRTRRMPSPGVLAGASLAMLGLVGVLGVTGAVALDAVGLAFAACAALGNACYFALSARPLTVPPVALAGISMGVGAAAVTALGVIGILPVAMAAGTVPLLGHEVSYLLPLIIVGALPTAVAYGISVISVRLLGERVASFVGLSEVIFSALLAWVVLHEAPTPVQWAGCLGVVAGVALVRRYAEPVPVSSLQASLPHPTGSQPREVVAASAPAP